MDQNIPELLAFFVWYFPTLRSYFSDHRSYYNRNNELTDLVSRKDQRTSITSKLTELENPKELANQQN